MSTYLVSNDYGIFGANIYKRLVRLTIMPADKVSGGCALLYSSTPDRLRINMEVFLSSVSLIGIAEIGDKTQLLSILLAARYRTFWPIFFGVLLATLFNHAGSAYTGKMIADYITPQIIAYTTAAIFIGLGLWILIPDAAPEESEEPSKHGAFIASFIAFFIAEMGDKTQFATITLGAQYADTLMVTIGTTVGMMLANVPAIICGDKIMKYIPMNYVHKFASVLFITYGLYSLSSVL